MPIEVVDEAIKQLAQDMLTTMYEAPGIGLAAPQVNHLIRLIVVDISEDKNEPQVFINPVITHKDQVQVSPEGCLSIPGVYADIERAEHIIVEALDAKGEPFTLEAHDLLAVCIQHEIDHLDGKLFVDYLSKLKQNRILKKIQKESKQA